MANYRDKDCIVCGKKFKPISPKQKTCSSKECRNEVRRRAERKRYKKKQEVYQKKCKLCGKEFLSTDSRKVYCDSSECSGNFRRVKIKSTNKNKKTLQEVKDYFSSFGYTVLSKRYIGSHSKLEYLCPKGHKNKMSWTNFQSGYRCPDCSGKKKKSFEEVKQVFLNYGYTLLSTEYVNSSSYLYYECCEGHKNKITWSDFNTGYRCPDCYGNKRKNIQDVKKVFEKEEYVLLSEEYINNRTNLEYVCPKGHLGTITWDSWNQGGRCLECSGRKKLDIGFVGDELSKMGYTLLSKEYVNARTPLKYICPKGHTSSSTWDNLYNKRQGCFKCSCAERSSKGEKELYDFVCSLVGEDNVIANDRELIYPYELDIYIPSKNLAIEYCGLYWHSEVAGNKPKKYHVDKMKACNSKGVRLITIFEDEYLDKSEVVKSRVQNALGVGLRRIYARKCAVKEIETKTAKDFMLKYHLQGTTGARVKWGLFYKEELVQVLTCGVMSRTHTGKLKGCPDAKLIELKRFASKTGVSVVGGAGKLFKVLKKYAIENEFTHIKSYCDMRYANNFRPVYEVLNFSLLTSTHYTPHYTKSGKRHRNQGLRKTPIERLTGKTEWQLRKEEGYDRIWDVGHRTYIYEI